MKILKWIFIIGLNIYLVVSFIAPIRVVAPDSKGTLLDKNIIYEMINEYRVTNNLPILIESTLCDYAQERSNEIITDWSHKQFRKDGSEGKLFSTVCPHCHYVGENLAQGQLYNEQLILDWKNSPEHNKNLLDPDWEIMCVAISWRMNIPYTALEFGGDIDGK